MNLLTNGGESGWRGWRRVGVAAGMAGLLSVTAACGATKTVAREADNPAAREAATKMMHFGDQAAKDFADSGNMMMRGFSKLDTGNTLTETMRNSSGNYAIEIEHTPGALADRELSDEEVAKIKCVVAGFVQLRPGVQEYVDGTSVWQRGADEQWYETIASNNKDAFDLCKFVLSTMPGAENN